MNRMKRPGYIVQCNNHPIHQTKELCMFMEKKELVDLTVTCNTFSVKVHKCVLAAGSTYFLEHLQKDMNIDRVVIHGIPHYIMKALIEYMYCGETCVPEEYMDDLITAANFFGIRGISAIVPESLGVHHKSEPVSMCKLATKPPQFLKKTPFDEKIRASKSTAVYHDANSKKYLISKKGKQSKALENESVVSKLFVKDTDIEATNPANEGSYEPDVIDELKFDASQLEISSDIKDELNEFLNMTQGGYAAKVDYQEATTSRDLQNINYEEVPEYVTAGFQESSFSQYPIQLDTLQNESLYILKSGQALDEATLTYNQLVQDTVTSGYNLAASSAYNTAEPSASDQDMQYLAEENMAAKNEATE